MTDIHTIATSRRSLLAGFGLGAGALVLPGCSSFGYGPIDAIERLLLLSSQRAFDRMTAPGGFWDQQVAQIGLNSIFGSRGDVLSRILTGGLFKNRLEDAFADIAVDGAEAAAPIVYDTVRTIGYRNAADLITGGPRAATSFLRGNMGTTLIEAMVPELGQAMRISQDPLIGQVVSGLSGVDVNGISRNFSSGIDNAIWNEIGFEEENIRRDPRSTRDPAIIAVFGGAGAF